MIDAQTVESDVSSDGPVDDEDVKLDQFTFRINRGRYAPVIVDQILGGGYEAQERSTVRKILVEGDRILEVGTAIGAVTMTCASIIGAENITTFEANPKILQDARRNFELNGLSIKSTNCILQNRTLFRGEGTTSLFHVSEEFWASSIKAHKHGVSDRIDVPCMCLEDEAAKFGANTLICDIEGGEIELLLDADLSMFNKIMMEIHYWAGREEINRMMHKLILTGFIVDFDFTGSSTVVLNRGYTRDYRGW
jgi:FkbM family methyltransferase